MDNLIIPKGWLTGILVPRGEHKGELAQPCMCGEPTEPDGDRILYLVQWTDGRLMFCHQECCGDPENA